MVWDSTRFGCATTPERDYIRNNGTNNGKRLRRAHRRTRGKQKRAENITIHSENDLC